MGMETKLYTTKDVADELNVAISTVERWRSTGQFVPAGRTAGNHSRYTEEQVRLAKQGIFPNSIKDQVFTTPTGKLNLVGGRKASRYARRVKMKNIIDSLIS